MASYEGVICGLPYCTGVTEAVAEQPASSETVTIYVVPETALAYCSPVPAPLSHTYDKVPVASVASASITIFPLHNPEV